MKYRTTVTARKISDPNSRQFTTKDLQARLLDSLNEDSIAARNSVARIGAVMIATKQLEINSAGNHVEPVVLIDGSSS
jgi:hypothetical protein